MGKDNRNKALLLGTITYAIGNFGTKIISFLIVPLYTYYISTGDMGDYDLLTTTAVLLSPLITLKIAEASYRWIINDRENSSKTISATYQLLIQNCFIAAIVILVINYFFPIWNCWYFIGVLLTDRIMECLQKLLRGLGNQKLFALSGVLYTAVLVTYNLVMITVFHAGVNAMLQGILIGHVFTISFILLYEKRLRVFDLPKGFRKLQRDMIKYSAPLVPSALCWNVMNISDRYIIRWFLGKDANGIFAVAHKFPTILNTIFIMFNNAWTDMALSQLEGADDSKEYVSKLFKRYYKFAFGMALVLIPLTKILTQLVLSPSYKIASTYIGLLYLGTVFQGFSSFCSIGYLKNKRTGGAAYSSAFGAIINLLIDIFLMKYIGLYAAALSTFFGFFGMWCMRMRDIKDVFPVIIDKKSFSINFMLCIIMAIVSAWTTVFVDVFLSIASIIYFYVFNKEIIDKSTTKLIRKVAKKVTR